MAASLPFLSQQQVDDEPPLLWDNFLHPKLGRFCSSSSYHLGEYLGGGVDGFVFKAKLDGQHRVAVKIFHETRRPNSSRENPAKLYWAFERECINCALLQMINASLRRAGETNRPISILPTPTTRSQALRNLWAFSDEGREQGTPGAEDLQPFKPDVQVNRCFGWTELAGDRIIRALQRAHEFQDIRKAEKYFAIVYDFVPKGKLEASAILAQLDFFHLTGFHNVPFNPTNWLGNGTLVDFSDIVSPLAREPEWRQRDYAIVQQGFHEYIRMLEKMGQLATFWSKPVPTSLPSARR